MAKDKPGAGVPVQIEDLQGKEGQAVQAEMLRRSQEGFSGAVVVEVDGVLALKAGYGWANREKQIPFTPATIAQIGSLTKQFTAAAISGLASSGRIDFSGSLGKYLPGVPARAAGLTVHQLLTHTAGLPDICGDDFDRLSREELITGCLPEIELSPPGDFSYSNLGYSLLAAVVEHVSGIPHEDYLAENFFAPAGMSRTGYFFEDALQEELAWGYTGEVPHAPISDRLRPLAPDFWNLKGNGGMQSSPEEMYAWYRVFAHRPGEFEALRKVMLVPHAPAGEGVFQGYGWFVRTDSAGEVLQASHTGGDGVFFAAIVWRPLDRVFFYLVSNVGNDAGAEAASKVLRILRDREDGG
jgi:CubicO group peptidase (beta-lactamase class C family)